MSNNKSSIINNQSSILIVSAVNSEIQPLKDFLQKYKTAENRYSVNGKKISLLITGIGLTNTVYFLTKKLYKKKYDIIINAGICGSFDTLMPLGEVVEVVSDEFADLGITHKDNFKTVFEENFIKKNQFPFENGKLLNNNHNFSSNLKKVKSISVNATSGNKEQINLRTEKFNPDIETMEGAGFFFVCKNEKIPCLQIRAISNYVEIRNIEKWNIPLAIKNLNDVLQKIIII